MLGFGAANIAAGLFSAFPVTASDSRTAINASVGGRSQLAGVVAAAALLLTILYLQPALSILPIPALGAILIAAALSLIDIPALREIWRISRIEFVFAMIALCRPDHASGVLNGVLVAIGATFAYLLRKMMYPRDALLGRIPGRDGFYKLHRRPDARPVPGLAIALIEGDLLFFNADHIQARLLAIADAMADGHPLARARRQRHHPDRLAPPPRCSRRSAPTSPPAASPWRSPSCTPRSAACSTAPACSPPSAPT